MQASGLHMRPANENQQRALLRCRNGDALQGTARLNNTVSEVNASSLTQSPIRDPSSAEAVEIRGRTDPHPRLKSRGFSFMGHEAAD